MALGDTGSEIFGKRIRVERHPDNMAARAINIRTAKCSMLNKRLKSVDFKQLFILNNIRMLEKPIFQTSY